MIKKGYKCNYITVISDEILRKNRASYFLCKCKCGNVRYVHYNVLKYRNIQDCGCMSYSLDKTKKEQIGKKYGLLTIIDCFIKENNGKIMMTRCECECGKIIECDLTSLKNGHIKSCGCIKNFNFERNYKNKVYHGITILDLIDEKKKIVYCKCHCGNVFTAPLIELTKKRRYIIGCKKCNNDKGLLYNIKATEELSNGDIKSVLYGMRRRCYNTKSKDYKWYGGKGVVLCEEWKTNSDSFVEWALNNGYKKGLTIDRIDSNGNYEPSNCRWVDMTTQNNNQPLHKKYMVDGELLGVCQIARKYNMNRTTLQGRLRRGMTIDEAIAQKLKKNAKRVE